MAFAVLLPGASYAQPAYHVLDGSPLWQPFWGLFGDFDLEAMEETTPFRCLAPALPPALPLPLILLLPLPLPLPLPPTLPLAPAPTPALPLALTLP